MRRMIVYIVVICTMVSYCGIPLIVSASESSTMASTLVSYDGLSAENYGEGPGSIETMTDGSSFTTNVELTPNLAETYYPERENFTICFTFSYAVEYDEVDYGAAGFTLINIREMEGSGFEVCLRYDETTEKPTFTLHLYADSHEILTSSIFGYHTTEGLFLSRVSHDSAKHDYYYHLLGCGEITLSEYRARLRNSFHGMATATLTTERMTFQDDVVASQVYGVNAVAETNSLSTAYVQGTLQWKDRSGVLHPAQYTKVELCIWGEAPRVTYTDVNGYYHFAIYTNYNEQKTFRLRVHAGSEASAVRLHYEGETQGATWVDNVTDSGYYVWESADAHALWGTTTTINWETDMNSDFGKAFQISQVVAVAEQYVIQMDHQVPSFVNVAFPALNMANCKYNDEIIYVPLKTNVAAWIYSFESWDVIMHEYGHHVQHELGIRGLPGLHFGSSLDLVNSNGKETGIGLAWGEAYPFVFSGMVQAYYADSLPNIRFVGGATYESYNGVCINYETPLVYTKDKDKLEDPEPDLIYEPVGEACERDTIGVMWDLYDSVVETHDNFSMSHEAYWALMKNFGVWVQNYGSWIQQAQADPTVTIHTNFSEFWNFFVSTKTNEEILEASRILAYHGFSSDDVSCDLSGNTPVFSWTPRTTSSNMPHNSFTLIFYDSLYREIHRISNITTCSYTLSPYERNVVLNGYGDTCYVVVASYQTATPETGGYYSAPIVISTPDTVLNTNGLDSSRYSERYFNLERGYFYKLYVTFNTSGPMLIQTFGTTATYIELLSADGSSLAACEAGYSGNTFISYNVTANTQYVIYLRTWMIPGEGQTKLTITPADGLLSDAATAMTNYNSILTVTDPQNSNLYASVPTSVVLGRTRVMKYVPPVSGTYTIRTTGNIDTFLYVIDPRSTALLIEDVDYNDDGESSEDGYNARLTRTLEAGIPYFIILATYDITDDEVGPVTLYISFQSLPS